MKREKGLALNVGTPSILMILLVFALTVFSLLSIGVSNHEWKLAKKTSASVTEYYLADQKAEYLLSKIVPMLETATAKELSGQLEQLRDTKDDRLEGLEQLSVEWKENATFVNDASETEEEIGTVSYEIKIRENAGLQVKLSIYNNRKYEIVAWNMKQESADYMEIEDSFELWDGDPLGVK